MSVLFHMINFTYIVFGWFSNAFYISISYFCDFIHLVLLPQLSKACSALYTAFIVFHCW